MRVTLYEPCVEYKWEGFVTVETGEPSPKFQEYAGDPVEVLIKLIFIGAHPEKAEDVKLAIGAELTVIVFIVSSIHEEVDTVRVTLNVPIPE